MLCLPVQVTLALQPLFKRSISFLKLDDSDLAEQVASWGRLHEFGDITWLPEERKVIYRQDDRVDVSTPGNGLNDNLGFRPLSASDLVASRTQGVRRLLIVYKNLPTRTARTVHAYTDRDGGYCVQMKICRRTAQTPSCARRTGLRRRIWRAEHSATPTTASTSRGTRW